MSLLGQMLVNDQSNPIIFLFKPFESIYVVHIYRDQTQFYTRVKFI
jgi:hypothetical protein